MITGLKITEDHVGEVAILRLEGRLDATSTITLEKKITELLKNSCTRLLIDCAKLNYLSSSGMRLLLSSSKKLKSQKGHLLFCSIGNEVMEVIKMAGFERILTIYPNEEEALKT